MSYPSTLWLSALGMQDESERAVSQYNLKASRLSGLQVGFKTVIIYYYFTAQASLSW